MFLRICTVVPTYNNVGTVHSVVKDLLGQTPYHVLVIDDGSDIPVTETLRGLVEQEGARLSILLHPSNRGKGRALQTGFQEALKRGFTHVLAFDADGQHLAHEISRLVEEIQKHPFSLVIGAREMAGETVPEVSRFGRKFSNFWVDRETGIKIKDSQSGMRIYPLFYLQTMRFFTSRYDFEIEILIRLLWKGVEIREVPVTVYYAAQGRISHFHKVFDNIRLSFLNTILVFLSMLRLHRHPLQVGLAVGLGVFIGTTPFFGFHTPIAFVSAFMFRLNFAYLWLGTQISLPPLAPLLVAASLEIDKLVFPGVSSNFFLEWLDGSLVLGAGLGLVLGGLAGLGAWFFQTRSRRKLHWTGKMRGGKFGNTFLKTVLRVGGLKAGYRCLYGIVPYFYFFAPRATRASNEYWKVVDPASPFFKRQGLVLKHYYQFGKVLLDRAYQGIFPEKVFQTLSHGAEYIIQAHKDQKGLILLSAHVGSWDIAAFHMQFKGLQKKFHTVEYGADSHPAADKPGHFIQSIFHNQTVHAVLDVQGVLGNGRPIGMMGDRPTTRRFELVSFCGKLIAIDVTAFRVAATLGVELLFTFGFRKGDGQYAFFATPPKRYGFDQVRSQDEQCHLWASEFAHLLETFVKQHKEQWFNFYPFFSSLPVPV